MTRRPFLSRKSWNEKGSPEGEAGVWGVAESIKGTRRKTSPTSALDALFISLEKTHGRGQRQSTIAQSLRLENPSGMCYFGPESRPGTPARGRSSMDYDIKDPSLAAKGRLRME